MFQHMAESRRMIERGHKTDSYISAVSGNPVPITLPKTDATQKEAFLIQEQSSEPKPVGLTSDELQYYKNDSFWKTLRRILFILFWLTWILLFCIAILLITRSPGYFDGISAKLTQLRQIGINGIFPRPFISAEESALGAIDYKSVADSIGGFTQAQKFINEAHKEG
uniref:Solute carrier family 3 member 2 N-terminal domain-containing protein n=1 Tax=Panagrolaimus sp. PS1159 TaxID=55785 RepID=A0AC35FZK7_9BILA